MEAKKNPQLEIGRNSGIYFAIGLNLMLLLSWSALEYKTYEQDEVDIGIVDMQSQFEEEIPIINADVPPPPPPPAVVSESVQVVEDTEEIEETIIESTEITQETAIADPVEVSEIIVEEVEEDVQVAFAIIEDVPVFPGCEGMSREETKNCFQKKMQEHVVKHFTYPQTALDMGLQGRVSVLFIIDSKGYITGIRSRGPDKILEEEAERIVNKLPQMKPGMQRGKPVKVAYAIPIFFKLLDG